MNSSGIRALFLLCLLVCGACRSAAPVYHSTTSYAAFAPVHNDPLRFGFDWRMGLADSLRAGSVLFFRFELDAAGAEKLRDVNVIDKFASQFGIDHELVLVEGREKTIGVLSFSPEETAQLPAGPYDIAVELHFGDGTVLLSKLLSFHLLPRDKPLGDTMLQEERRRFAALLQLNNDKSSYDAVAPLVVDVSYQNNVLARLLRFYDANIQRPVAGEGPGEAAVQKLAEWTQNKELTVRERELSILALEEVYARFHGAVRNDK